MRDAFDALFMIIGLAVIGLICWGLGVALWMEWRRWRRKEEK